jgi:hypothetical protein
LKPIDFGWLSQITNENHILLEKVDAVVFFSAFLAICTSYVLGITKA